MEFAERLQIGCHQATAEAFAKTFDGNKARVGPWKSKWMRLSLPQLQDYQELVKDGLKPPLLKIWISEFYLKEGYKHKAWRKGMLVSYLDEEWQELFKGIQLYITSEGRYDKLMMYHFKLWITSQARPPSICLISYITV
jgi:hypothetical protein